MAQPRRPAVKDDGVLDGVRVLVVEARFYDDIADALLAGAKRAFEKQGATRDLVRSIQQLAAHKRLHIEPVEADADKISRAMIITGRAKAGLVSVDRKAPWWHALSSEMSRFPRSAHDDRVDALAYVVRLAVERLANVRAMLIAMSGPVSVKHTGALVGGRYSRREA